MLSDLANGKLVALEAVNGLTQNEEKTVTSSFKPVAGGHYEISTMVDGPRSRIVEFSESNNKQRIELDINMVYPDLELGDMQITPATGVLAPNEPIIVTLGLTNKGAAVADDEIEIDFYAGDIFMGSLERRNIANDEIVPLSFVWKKPVSGIKKVHAIVNNRKNIIESDYENNGISAEFGAAVEAKLQGIEIIDIASETPSGEIGYNSDVTTSVRIKNNGNADIVEEYNMVLYVNGIKKSEKLVTSSLGVGQEALIEMPSWTADILPTGKYELVAYADSDMRMRLVDRSTAQKKKVLRVKGEYMVATNSIPGISPAGKARFVAELTSSDMPRRSLQTGSEIGRAHV